MTLRLGAILLLLLISSADAQRYGRSVSGMCVPAVSNKSITTPPTAPNSTTAYKMQGLAGSFTAACSGITKIVLSGTIYEPAGTGAATIGILHQISYGTGTAPGSNATLTGTQVGVKQEERSGFALAAIADGFWPFRISALANLTAGTTYWIDLAAESVGTVSDMGFSNVNINARELY